MRSWVIELICGTACSAALCSVAAAGPREEAVKIVESWTAAFAASDVDAIVKLHAPDATFLGTRSTTLVKTPEGIRQYFERALLNNRPRGAALGEHAVAVLSETEVLVSGFDTVTSVVDGRRISAEGRVTFVIAQRGADWQIVHFHRSALPVF